MKTQSDPMTIAVQECGDYAVLQPAGYLNALTGDLIDKACAELIGRGTRYLIINFSEITMVNTIGISILVGIIEKALEQGGLAYFTELGLTDRRIFEVLNLGTVAVIFDSDDEAITHLRRDQEAVRRSELG